MKKCPKCYKKNKTNSSYCPPCHAEYQRVWYKKNPHSNRESSKRRKKEIRDLIISYKKRPCQDCGQSYPYYVMDFDHVRGKKKFNLSVAANKYRSVKIVMDEIAKCEVVCANCHRERTFNRQ